MEERVPLVFREPPAHGRVKETPPGERPRERLCRRGPLALSDAELLAIILGSGVEGDDVCKIAARLARDGGSLAGLVGMSHGDFETYRGVGKVKAIQLEAIFEIARRVVEQGKIALPVFDEPARVFAYFQDLVMGLDVEKCWVLCLNHRRRLIRCEEVTKGTGDSTLISPACVFRPAIRNGARVVILVHNHPSGDPEPSKQDFTATRKIREAASVLDIELQDHIIIGKKGADRLDLGWFSFRGAGVL